MRYDPKAADRLLPAGDYKATIESAVEGLSKKNNEMITVKLRIYGTSGQFLIDDWITNPDGIWKLKQIAKALGKLDVFDAGEFVVADYVGDSLTVTLKVDKGNDDYPEEKNRVKAYKPKQLGVATGGNVPMHESEAPADASIPF